MAELGYNLKEMGTVNLSFDNDQYSTTFPQNIKINILARLLVTDGRVVRAGISAI